MSGTFNKKFQELSSDDIEYILGAIDARLEFELSDDVIQLHEIPSKLNLQDLYSGNPQEIVFKQLHTRKYL